MVQKVNPEFKLEAHSYIGKDLTEMKVDFVTDFDATSLASARAPEGAIHKALQVVMDRAAIVMIDASGMEVGSDDVDTQMTVVVEGHFPADAYPGADDFEGADRNDGFHDLVQRDIRKLGNITTTGTSAGSYNLDAVTVTTEKVYKAQQV